MRDFQRDLRVPERKPHGKGKKYSKMLLLFMFIAFVLITKGAFNVYAKERESRGEIARIEGEKGELQKRYDAIRKESDSLKSDAGVEAEIRGKFDVVKPGEKVIVIVDKEMPIVEEDKRGILKKFWDSVKGVFGAKTSATSSGEAAKGAGPGEIDSANVN